MRTVGRVGRLEGVLVRRRGVHGDGGALDRGSGQVLGKGIGLALESGDVDTDMESEVAEWQMVDSLGVDGSLLVGHFGRNLGLGTH